MIRISELDDDDDDRKWWKWVENEEELKFVIEELSIAIEDVENDID